MKRNKDNHEDAIIGAMILGVPVFDLAPSQFLPTFFSDPVFRSAYAQGEAAGGDVNRFQMSERIAADMDCDSADVLARFDRIAMAAGKVDEDEARQHFEQIVAEYVVEKSEQFERTKAKMIADGKTAEAMRYASDRAEYLAGLMEDDDHDRGLHEEIEEFNNPTREPKIITTGVDFIDGYFGGFEEGDLVLIPGHSSQGKSSFAVHLAATFNRIGGGVGFISMEEPESKIAGSVAAHDTNRSRSEFKGISKNKGLNDETHDALMGLDIANADRFRLRFLPGGDLRTIQRTAARMVRQHGAKMIIVDHANLIRVPGKHSEYEELREASAALKAMAGRLGIVVVVPTQLNRGGVDAKTNDQYPLSTSQLRGSGTLVQDADIICGLEMQRLVETTYENAHKGENAKKAFEARHVIVDFRYLKNRNGRVGFKRLRWDKEKGIFTLFDGETGEGMYRPRHQSGEGF